MRRLVWAGVPGWSRLQEVSLDADPIPGGLRAGHLTVVDESLVSADQPPGCAGHAGGGGPLATAEQQRDAAWFGVANAFFHADRALGAATTMLGTALPRLSIRIGCHDRWGGGHYRLPARACEPPERHAVSIHGEVHLGSGARYVHDGAGRYFNHAAHNAAIIYHEVGHHLCRHTADFRLNRSRPSADQDNGKTPLDEGTSDWFTAVLLGTPDIFGWHRGDQPRASQLRRAVDGGWTMAVFRGGHDQDPHIDGTVWSGAMWAARRAATDAGATPGHFDRAVGSALLALGRPAERSTAELRRRRYLSRAAAEVVTASAAGFGEQVACAVSDAFAARGIVGDLSNAVLRDRARAVLVGCP